MGSAGRSGCSCRPATSAALPERGCCLRDCPKGGSNSWPIAALTPTGVARTWQSRAYPPGCPRKGAERYLIPMTRGCDGSATGLKHPCPPEGLAARCVRCLELFLSECVLATTVIDCLKPLWGLHPGDSEECAVRNICETASIAVSIWETTSKCFSNELRRHKVAGFRVNGANSESRHSVCITPI